jgi:hypothetical protein
MTHDQRRTRLFLVSPGRPRVARQEHVRGFEVAMDDASLVGGIERLRDLSCHRQGLGRWDRAAHQSVGERLPFDEFQYKTPHTQAVGRGRVLESVDRTNMGMVQRGQGACLAFEA